MSVASATKSKTEYSDSTPQENQQPTPSPLALLAATCSKIGSSVASSEQQHQQQLSNEQQASQQQQYGIVLNQLQMSAAASAGQQIRVIKNDEGTPQVITLSQLQNFLPIPQAVCSEAGSAVASSSMSNAQPSVKTEVKTFVSSAGGNPQVVSVGLPQQFLQQQGQQLVNAAAAANGGQNLTYNVMQPMQTVTVDGQEALFIPAAMAGGQPQSVQQIFSPAGQILRAPGLLPTNILQNMAGQTVQLPTGQNVAVRPSMPQMVQFPMQQTIPVQVPITSSNGQTVYQTVHFPVQAFATAAMPNIIQAQGNQMQIIPQLAQPQQVASIITPNGQIQQVQLASVAQQQSVMAQVAAQVSVANSNAATSGTWTTTTPSTPSVTVQAMSANNIPVTENTNAQNSNPVNLLQAGNQPITFTGAGGQQYTVIPASSINLGTPIRHGTNIIQVRMNRFQLQEAATSTQSVSSDSSSNDEKMMITITTEADQSDMAMADTLESSISN